MAGNFRWLFYVIPLSLALLAGILQYYAVFPDTIAYLDIAAQYAHGNYLEAFNMYWSPMISWLAAILLKLSIPELLAIRIINFVLLCVAVPLWYRLCELIGVKTQSWLLNAVKLTGSINMAYFSQSMLGPDFMSVFIVIVFIKELLFERRIYLLGFLLLLMFFIKTYLFFFGFVVIMMVLFWENKNRPGTFVKKGVLISLIFAPFIIVWTTIGYYKYKNIQLSTAGKYNSIARIESGFDHFWLKGGLIAPPTPNSRFAWTDISNIYGKYSNLKSGNRNLVSIVICNFYKALRLFMFNCLPGLLAILLVFYQLFFKKKRVSKEAIYIVTMVVVYVGGYLFFAAEHRYLWPSFLMVSLIPLTIDFDFKGVLKPVYIYGTFILIFVFNCTHSLVRIFDTRYNKDDKPNAFALSLVVPSGSHIASYHTKQTWIVSFYNKYRDYGGIAGENKDSLMYKLKNYNIDYIIAPDSNAKQLKQLFGNKAKHIGKLWVVNTKE